MSAAEDLDRFFPVIPVAVPRDDLRDYLSLYAQESGAYLASQRSHAALNPYERYLNTRMPVMRALAGFGIVGQAIGADPTALTNTQAGTTLVSSTWAQQAANAYATVLGSSLIAVDGIVGPNTLALLRSEYNSWWRGTTGPFLPVTQSGSGVALDSGFANFLAQLIQVRDPVIRTPAPAAPAAPATLGPQAPTAPDATQVVQGAVSVGASGIGTAVGLGIVALLGLYAMSRRGKQ